MSGGCRGLERLEDPFSELDSEDIVVEEIERFAGRERKVLPIILSLATIFFPTRSLTHSHSSSSSAIINYTCTFGFWVSLSRIQTYL